jgi:PAS domain S-box-containing protein
MRSSGEPPKQEKSRPAPRTGREGPGRSPEWQEAIFEGSRDAIFISDEDSRFIAVNRAACDLTGYAREELLDLRIPDLHDDVNLDAYHRYHDLIMAGQDALSEAQLLRKDGTKVATEFNNSRIVIGGTRYMHTTARNITERRRAEAAFRERDEFCQRIFDGANDGMVIIGLGGQILEANLTASRRLGYTVDELKRMTVAEIDSPEVAAGVPEKIARILGEGHAIFETVHQRRDGTQIPTEVSSRLIDHRGATAILSIFRDLSERKRLEEEMRKLGHQYT